MPQKNPKTCPECGEIKSMSPLQKRCIECGIKKDRERSKQYNRARAEKIGYKHYAKRKTCRDYSINDHHGEFIPYIQK